MTLDRISVVIPVRDRTEELIRAIDSVFWQTRPADQIIVVDDGSDSPVIDFLKSRYGNAVTVITNAKNLGAAESRNIGVRAAAGEFIAFLDSDDFWHPEKTAKQLSVFKKNDAIGLVYCDQWLVDRDGRLRESRKALYETELWGHLLEGWTAPNTSTLILRKDVFLQLGGFDSGLRSCTDHDLWMRIARSGVRVAVVPERLSHFSMNISGSRTSFNSALRTAGMRTFLSRWKREIIDSHGMRTYWRFKRDYWIKVVFPLVNFSLRQRHLLAATTLFSRYLLWNPLFYIKSLSAGAGRIQAVFRGAKKG